MGKLLRKMRKGKNGSRYVDDIEKMEELEWLDFDEEEDEDYEEDEDEDYEEDDEDYEIDEDEDCEEEDEGYEENEDEDYEEDDEDYEVDEDGDYEEDDEDYEEDEDEDYDEDYEIEDEVPGGVFKKIIYKITHMSAVDHIVAFTGVVVLVLAVFTGIMYLNARSNKQQVEAFAEIGVGMEDIGIIGESGLLAISDAQAAKLVAAEI